MSMLPAGLHRGDADHGDADRGDADDAVARHLAAMRRQRRWYFGIVGAVVLAVAAAVAVVWSGSEIVHAQLHTARSAPPDVPPGQLTANPTLAWRSDERSAIGEPFQGGTVVTFGTHSVHGRDARTGAVTWTYTRTDRTVCQVVQEQDRTIAFFRHNGNCDEVDAFITGTGQRAWDRTLDSSGQPVNGEPLIIPQADGLFVSTATVVYAIRIKEGYDFWEYPAPDGCRTTGIAVGSTGALIAQHCTDGDHLLLRDRFAGTDAKDHPVTWRLNHTTARPFAADSFIAAIDPSTHELLRYDPKKGTVIGRVALRPAPPAQGTAEQLAASDGELVWLGGTTYAIDSSGSRQLWSASTPTLPTISAASTPDQPPSLTSPVLAATPRGVEVLDGATGRVSRTLPTPTPPPAGSRVFPAGTGFVVAGSSTTVYR